MLDFVSTSRCDAAAVIAAWLASSTPTSNNSAACNDMFAVCAMLSLRRSIRPLLMLSKSVDNASRVGSCGQIAAVDQGHAFTRCRPDQARNVRKKLFSAATFVV